MKIKSMLTVSSSAKVVRRTLINGGRNRGGISRSWPYERTSVINRRPDECKLLEKTFSQRTGKSSAKRTGVGGGRGKIA